MEIINTVQAAPQSACSLALGTFDGLHRGHLAVVGAALAGANAAGWEPAVFTFRRSPSGERLVMTGQDKARLLEELGVARMYEMDFAAVKDLPAEDFVRDMLFTRLNVRQVCCGEDFRFGRGAAGDKSLLARLCGEAGVKLTVVPRGKTGRKSALPASARHWSRGTRQRPTVCWAGGSALSWR